MKATEKGERKDLLHTNKMKGMKSHIFKCFYNLFRQRAFYIKVFKDQVFHRPFSCEWGELLNGSNESY